MQFPTISTLLLLPALALAQSSSPTTTITSTTMLTKTITVSQVVASVTSTYPVHNSTVHLGATAYGTAYGTGSRTSVYISSSSSSSSSSSGAATSNPAPMAPPAPTPSSIVGLGAASSLNSMYAGSAGLVVMIAAALL